mgnify:CR=1 FL=1
MFLILKYNKFIFSGLMIVALFLIMAPAVLALADAENSTGLNTTAGGGFGKEIISSDTKLPSLIGKIVGTGLALVGVIFFVILVYAGIGWMLAMGKEEKINEAKDMIVSAILGLIVVLSAYAITTLVGGIFNTI